MKDWINELLNNEWMNVLLNKWVSDDWIMDELIRRINARMAEWIWWMNKQDEWMNRNNDLKNEWFNNEWIIEYVK